MDLTARTVRLPQPGETVHALGYTVGLGGKGANQAAAAARLATSLGVDVALAGRVGGDAFGVQARTHLEVFGVDLHALRDDPEHPTGIALIGIDATGENCITVAGGANLSVEAEDVAAATALFARANILLLQLEIPPAAALAAAQAVRAHGRGRVIFDPAPAPEAGVMDPLWSMIDVVTPNEHETGRLTGVTPQTPTDAARAAAILRERGVGSVLIKMGARGVYWTDGSEEGFQPPFKVTAIDTVAAGDCFNAGLAIALSLGQDLRSATRVAAACGALATTRNGAADAAPQWAEVEALLNTV